MKDYIEERTLEVAKYIIANKSTVRDTAKVFGCSKSTIHKDLSKWNDLEKYILQFIFHNKLGSSNTLRPLIVREVAIA